jgi:hypothetical protein
MNFLSRLIESIAISTREYLLQLEILTLIMLKKLYLKIEKDLMMLLQMLEGVNIFVISLKVDILQDNFSNVIRFEKVKNFSRIIK